jgi:hypothetical protein
MGVLKVGSPPVGQVPFASRDVLATHANIEISGAVKSIFTSSVFVLSLPLKRQGMNNGLW